MCTLNNLNSKTLRQKHYIVEHDPKNLTKIDRHTLAVRSLYSVMDQCHTAHFGHLSMVVTFCGYVSNKLVMLIRFICCEKID